MLDAFLCSCNFLQYLFFVSWLFLSRLTDSCLSVCLSFKSFAAAPSAHSHWFCSLLFRLCGCLIMLLASLHIMSCITKIFWCSLHCWRQGHINYMSFLRGMISFGMSTSWHFFIDGNHFSLAALPLNILVQCRRKINEVILVNHL